VTQQTDAGSIATYGQWWRQQFFPALPSQADAVASLAQDQLRANKMGRRIISISPLPEKSPIPFEDYYLGDRVPVYASDQLRQPIPDNTDESDYQRVYGIPLQISDDATERVEQIITTVETA
jgi:hypothetical protein